ncbi:OmpH family outer membrane protein [Candidatus Pelagibacter communis]|uniref:OmpH family outer membrane protein n=1 Tax=Pelagibacter ubique TaxID=198252 RepID=UPI00094C3AD9|nr:OmpH family outer membrane protein [Candidatus Pelagibacter ubique]
MLLKGIIFIFFIILTNAQASEKIAYIDVDFILNNSLKGKLIIKKLNELNNKNLKELKNKENQLDEEKNEINSQQNILSEKELNKKIKNFKTKVKIFQKDKDLMFSNIEDVKKEELENFIKNISPIIEKYMTENSISILIDKKSVFIADPKYDITNAILKITDIKFNND